MLRQLSCFLVDSSPASITAKPHDTSYLQNDHDASIYSTVVCFHGEQIFHEVVQDISNCVGCELPSVLLVTRYEKSIKKLTCTSV